MSAAPIDVTQANSTTIDSLKLVHERQRLSGTLPIAGFLRLSEDLQSCTGNLDYRVQGDVDQRDRPVLRLQVSGTVELHCQRCLDGMAYGVDIDTMVRLVAADLLEAEQDNDPDEPDCIAASATFDLAALIEDEVLLALPAYPRHPEGLCSTVMKRQSSADEAHASGSQSGAKIVAFSALQALKQKINQSKE